MKKVKKIFSRIMTVFSAVIFLFGLFVFVSVLSASAGKVPNVLGYSFLQVQSGSMEPEFHVGTIVITKKVDPAELKVGDIISFYSVEKDIRGKVNSHRIAEITTNMVGTPEFVTKGDANPCNDQSTVSPVNLIGKVVYNLGTVSGSMLSVLRNPKVIFIFIVLPLLFITVGEAFNLATLIYESKEEKKEEKNGDKEDDGQSEKK